MKEDESNIDAELVKAAHNGSLDKLKVLVTRGAHLWTAKDEKNHTVEQIAKEEVHKIMSKVFMRTKTKWKEREKFVKIINFCEETGRAELSKALEDENFSAIIQIIEGGFELSPADGLTWSLLEAAIEHKHLELGKLLIPRYLNPYDTYKGMSVSQYVSHGEFRELVDHILSVSPKVSM